MDYKANMTNEKNAELWHDYGALKSKLTDACMKTKSATCLPSWKNRKEQKTLIVDVVGVMDEKRYCLWSAWLAALLKDSHFISKKGYTYREGILRYFVSPDWEYYGLKRDDYVVPPPPDKQADDDFDIDKQMRKLLEAV